MKKTFIHRFVLGLAFTGLAGYEVLAQVPDSQFGNNGSVFIATPGGGPSWSTVKILPDKSIVIGGSGIWRDTYAASSKAVVFNRDAAGNPRNEYGRYEGRAIIDIPGGGTDPYTSVVGRELIPLPDGRLLVAGYSDNKLFLTVLLENGQIDYSVGIKRLGNFSNLEILSATLLSDGKVAIAGTARNTTDSTTDFVVAKVSQQGILDTTFGKNGIAWVNFGADDVATQVLPAANGGLILVGYGKHEGRNTYLLSALKADGSFDTSFGDHGKAAWHVSHTGEDRAFKAAWHPNGTIVIAGSSTLQPSGKEDISVLNLNANGSLNTDFDYDARAFVFIAGKNDIAYDIAIAKDGSIYLSGVTQQWNEVYFQVITRLKANGELDRSFGIEGIYTIEDQPVLINRAFSQRQNTGIAIDANGHLVLAAVSDPTYTSLGRYLTRLLISPTITSLERSEYASDVSISPNPASEYVSISHQQELRAVEVVDVMTGRSIRTQSVNGNNERISLAGINNGVYVVKMFNASGEIAGKAKLTIRK